MRTVRSYAFTKWSGRQRASEGGLLLADFDAEIEAALRSAKRAAGFEFLGTLNRICLLPASGGVNTSEGIIINDTVYPYNSEESIIGELERLGLDPGDIKYVIISHAHGDHIGGSQILQDRFGAQVVMGGPDWVQRYFQVMQGCARAAQLRLEKEQAEAGVL